MHLKERRYSTHKGIFITLADTRLNTASSGGCGIIGVRCSWISGGSPVESPVSCLFMILVSSMSGGARYALSYCYAAIQARVNGCAIDVLFAIF